MKLRFPGASSEVALEGAERMAGAVNFLIGPDPAKWRTAIPAYKRIVYRSLYSGIDLTYSGAGSGIKSEFVVAPGANPDEIRLEYPDADRVVIGPDGGLVVTGAEAELRELAPEIYQESVNGRIPVAGRYRLLDQHTVGFELGHYDRLKPLVIDPAISYATYLGGSGMTALNGVATDASDNVYLAGWTEALNFPVQGAVQASNAGSVDVVVAKLSASGSSLLYATYIGGSSDDRAAAIAVDSSGEAYVTGFTTSYNFPVKLAYRNALAGGQNAFLLKLNAAGNGLLFSTYFGGSTWDQGTAVALDASGNPYIAGDTQSVNLPLLNPIQSTFGGQTDAFVAKFTSGGSLSFSTYLGGSAAEHAGGIAVDGSGNIYVAGGTFSTNFPVVAAMQASNAGGQDGFISKINAANYTLAYSTYFGGSGGSVLPEQINAIAVDTTGDAYVAGVTNSTNFPVTSTALRSAYNGAQDAFMAMFTPSGQLSYSTYLGGSEWNWASGIAVDWSGDAYVAGSTTSFDFPVQNPVQAALNGDSDAFISEINAASSTLLFSTFYGGSGSDAANGIALDSSGNMYAGGQTGSSDFPIDAAFEATYPGSPSGFVLSITAPLAAPVNPSPVNGASGVSNTPVLEWAESGATSFSVYLGTTSTPPLLTTTSVNSVSPGSLAAGQTYYWRVVASNGTISMSSPTWSFTVQAGSCSYNINPQSASLAMAGGSGSVSVSTSSTCVWTAASNASWLSVTSGASGTGSGTVNYSAAANTGSSSLMGTLTIAGLTFTVNEAAPGSPVLTIAVTNPGSLAAGQQGVQYAITVSNTSTVSTTGTVTVTGTPPSGLSVTSMSGTGWSCSGNICTRSDALGGGDSYPAITAIGDVSSPVASPLTYSVTVSGGGAASAGASDVATLTTALEFYPITPCRAVDTRASQDKTGAFGPPSLSAYSDRNFPILSAGCGVPTTALAYSLNLTVVPPGPLSFLSMWPEGQSYPGVSAMNSSNGSTLANAAIVPAGTNNGGVTVAAGNPTDLIIDINGYFAPPLAGMVFYPTPECRAVDTQAGSGFSGAFGPPSLVAYSQRNFSLTSSPCAVSSTVQAYSLNFTVVPTAGTLSFLSAWPDGQSYPGVSTLNSSTGIMTSNSALVPSGPASTGGGITVVGGNPTDLMIDVNGYFAAPATGGLNFYPVTPCRLVDTRAGQGKTGSFGPPSLVANASRSFPIPSAGCNIPSTAQVYALNVTVVPQGPLNSLALWATGQANPGISTMSSPSGNVIANSTLVAAGTSGAITVMAGNVTDFILDITGYFAP